MEQLLGLLEDELAPRTVRPLDDLGVPADAKEAVAFAVLASSLISAAIGSYPARKNTAKESTTGSETAWKSSWNRFKKNTPRKSMPVLR